MCACDWRTKTVCRACTDRILSLVDRIADRKWFDGEFGWKCEIVLGAAPKT